LNRSPEGWRLICGKLCSCQVFLQFDRLSANFCVIIAADGAITPIWAFRHGICIPNKHKGPDFVRP
ncbi:MAG: hypothetical protein ACYS3N_24240, partial [Planctomycetota bacterium]